MLAKTGLLVLTNPTQISKILPAVNEHVQHTLYIHLLSALNEPLGKFYDNILHTPPAYSQIIHGIYSNAAYHCQNLDVRVLLSSLMSKNISKIKTIQPIDMVIFDKDHNKDDIEKFIKGKIANTASLYNVVTLNSGEFEALDAPQENVVGVYPHAVLGGTFDRLHIAHKLMLSEAVLHSSSKITVGVTEENMLHGKVLWELIEDIETRILNVKSFLTDVCSSLTYDIVPISDAFGPTVTDPTMDLIVVSEETIKGGDKINEVRTEKSYKELRVVAIKLIDEPKPTPIEEAKISSGNQRIRLLGTLMKPVQENKSIPKSPYIIGLTGGIASGKSGVAKWISSQGAQIIDCDLLGHEVYRPGRPCHKLIVENFGNQVLTSEGEIDRKVLGSIVFKSKEGLQKLNSIVWPGIAEEIVKLIRESSSKVIVIEGAVLLQAAWNKFCHEIWSTFIPRSEAVKRLNIRNGLAEDQANARLQAQPSNRFYITNANVVFSTLWATEYTKQQVEKAWTLLQKRIY